MQLDDATIQEIADRVAAALAERHTSGTPRQDEPQPATDQPNAQPTERRATRVPDWLDGEEDYRRAPVGTTVVGSTPTDGLVKLPQGWETIPEGVKVGHPTQRRTVTRWGFGPGWEPGADVTDRLDQAPRGVIVRGRDDKCYQLGSSGIWTLVETKMGYWGYTYTADRVRGFGPLTVVPGEFVPTGGFNVALL